VYENLTGKSGKIGFCWDTDLKQLWHWLFTFGKVQVENLLMRECIKILIFI